jgi:hypothetical protein
MLIRRIGLFTSIPYGWEICWRFYPGREFTKADVDSGLVVALVAPKWIALAIRPIAMLFGYWQNGPNEWWCRRERRRFRC